MPQSHFVKEFLLAFPSSSPCCSHFHPRNPPSHQRKRRLTFHDFNHSARCASASCCLFTKLFGRTKFLMQN